MCGAPTIRPFSEIAGVFLFGSKPFRKLYVACEVVNMGSRLRLMEKVRDGEGAIASTRGRVRSPTPIPPGETRTNRQDCSDSLHLSGQKHHRSSRMRSEYRAAFRRH